MSDSVSLEYQQLRHKRWLANVPYLGFTEAHLIVDQFERTFVANYQAFAALGVEIAQTELDIRMTLPATDALLAAQAADYTYVINSCLAVSACVGITTWDTSDDYSWVPST